MFRDHRRLLLIAFLGAGLVPCPPPVNGATARAQAVSAGVGAGVGLTLNEVIATTLERSLSIRTSVEREQIRKSELRIARGAFDFSIGFTASAGRNSTLFERSEQELYGVTSSLAGISGYRLGAVRRFRSGLVISPAIEVIRRDALTLRAPPVVQTRADITFSYPVLRAGRTAPEATMVDAAALQLEAGAFDVRNTRLVSLLRAADAYWIYLSAYESHKILKASQAKAERLLRETKTLVEGGERPASDLDQLQADLADRFAARLRADLRLFESRQHLGMEIGLTADQAAELPPPITGFPRISTVSAVAGEDVLIGVANRRRYDLADALRMEDAARLMLEVRQIEAKPTLDLELNFGYAAQIERDLSFEHHLPPFGQHAIGRSSTAVALVLKWPIKNNRALGALSRQESAWRQSRIVGADLKRQIASRIHVALRELHTTWDELEKMDEAVHLYATAVENETKRLQLGMSTQFDLILVEERHRNTLLSFVAAEARYAQSIALLRYETGTLPGADPSTKVDLIVNALTTPPAPVE